MKCVEVLLRYFVCHDMFLEETSVIVCLCDDLRRPPSVLTFLIEGMEEYQAGDYHKLIPQHKEHAVANEVTREHLYVPHIQAKRTAKQIKDSRPPMLLIYSLILYSNK